MKNLKLFFTTTLALLTLSFSLISCGNSLLDSNGCYYDVDEAFKAAEKNNQDVMLIITIEGNDLQSEDFMNKVVRDPAFKKDIASKYAIVCMDFSQKTFEAANPAEDASESVKKAAEKKAELLQKNTKYAAMVDAKETPVVYILSKEKYLISGLFYDDENRTVDGFKAKLAEKSGSIDEMHKMIYQTKIGTSEEKVAAIDALYNATSPSYRFMLYDLLDSVKKLDPANKTGLLEQYVYEAAVAKSDLCVANGDARGAVNAYLELENEEALPAEVRQVAVYTAAYMCSSAGLEDNSVVISYLEKAIQLAPESEDVPRIHRVIDALSAQEK